MKVVSKIKAKKFLTDCKAIGIKRVGFTGGEPMLAIDLLCELVAAAVKEGYLFDRIMTNGVWYKNDEALKRTLRRISNAGYDGEICVSVDAFHKQNLKKIARFIKTASSIWNRPDIVSIARVRGSRDRATEEKLTKLAVILNGRLNGFEAGRPSIKTSELFIKIFNISLSPVGKAGRLKDPWGGRWFMEDYCKGPGNVFFVTPSGDVKPCCGYANDFKVFTIGNIGKESPRQLLKNFSQNGLLYAIFNSGLAHIRKGLERHGVKFPGKTDNHCYFCHHILTQVPKRTLEKCLD